MARSPAHAPAGSLWAGLMRLAALIVGQTSASFHYFHGLWRSDMNSVIYIIIKTRFDIDLTLLQATSSPGQWFQSMGNQICKSS